MKDNHKINYLNILVSEKKELDEILPSLYGYHLLQLGPSELAVKLNSSLISHRVHINSDLIAHEDQLPILSDSIDLVVLSHALEQGRKAHQILREAHRVLIPGGHIVITGFNPYSFWALKLFILERSLKLLSASRLKDWLGLLDFQIVGGRFFGGAYGLYPAYSIVAVKRVVPLTLVKQPWQKEKVVWVAGEVEGVS